jgi:hypothetical protein
MDSLFIEAVMQIVEFMDYPDALTFTSTCHEYYALRLSQSEMWVDKFKAYKPSVRIYLYYGLLSHKFYEFGDNEYTYCGECSWKIRKVNMLSHSRKCTRSKRMSGLCEYNKPHIHECNCLQKFQRGCFL